MKQNTWVLPTIIISQFCCTSLWFAGNGVMSDLVVNFHLKDSALSYLTSAVQFGFITGTLTFAFLAIADRFSPSKVFFISALLGALFNLGIIYKGHTLISIFSLRFFTGFFLGGIYPVGIKIAADYYDKKLSKSLGFLVGALVLGTALPHLLKGITAVFSWKSVLATTSCITILGGLLMLIMVPDGPYRKASQNFRLFNFYKIFRNADLRAAALGYFGHMWELYAFWAFVPVMIKTYNDLHPKTHFNIPIMSFLVIGLGSIGCILGGYISQKKGIKKTAFIALMLSCLCCFISPFVFKTSLEIVFIGFLLFWGIVVIADSPLFSTLVAQNASAEIKGTAITIVNCIGFSITIASIQLINGLKYLMTPTSIYVVLALGPLLGLVALLKKRTS